MRYFCRVLRLPTLRILSRPPAASSVPRLAIVRPPLVKFGPSADRAYAFALVAGVVPDGLAAHVAHPRRPAVLLLQSSILCRLAISSFWIFAQQRFDIRGGEGVMCRVARALALGALLGGVDASVSAALLSAGTLLANPPAGGLAGLAARCSSRATRNHAISTERRRGNMAV